MAESSEKPRADGQSAGVSSSTRGPVPVKSTGVGSRSPGNFGARPSSSSNQGDSFASKKSGSAGTVDRRRQQRPPVPSNGQHRINGQIRVPEVMLIGENGEQFGVLSFSEAMRKAEDAGLDLVEVAPQSRPPVCKLMDYGKFRYKEQKRVAEAKKNRQENTTKEIRLRYCTDSGDLATKLKNARQFILHGDKVKFSMRFKGREAMFANIGNEKLDLIVEDLSDIASVDERPGMSGRSLFLTMAPIKKK